MSRRRMPGNLCFLYTLNYFHLSLSTEAAAVAPRLLLVCCFPSLLWNCWLWDTSRKLGWATKGLRKERASYGSVVIEFQFAQFFDTPNPMNFDKFQLCIHLLVGCSNTGICMLGKGAYNAEFSFSECSGLISRSSFPSQHQMTFQNIWSCRLRKWISL